MANNKDSNARRGGLRLEAILMLACICLALLLTVPIYNSLNPSAFPRQDQDEQNSTEANTSKELLREVEPVILQAPEE
jgi:hypothetical protein